MSHVGSLLDKQTFERLRYGTWSADFIIGVTGSANGITHRQSDSLWLLLGSIKPRYLRHGDCIGVDYHAAHIADKLLIETIAHPPKVNTYRAFHKSNIILEPKDFLERDDDIARQSSLIIACPRESHEIKRSGTWATVRYARRAETPRIILLP